MIGLARSSLQYQAAQRDRDDDALRLALIRLAKQYGRYGYRKIAELLRIEGWKVNHKKVERIWREEGLQLPQRHKKRRRLYHKDASIIRLRPTHPNHVWSIDFVHDKLCNGRSYKMLTVLDEYTRQALAVAVRTRMGAEDVLEALYPLLLRYGTPKYIRSDNGPEFIAQTMQDWLARVGIKPIRIYPGSPWENGYNERFNGTLRHEVLNAEWFTTTTQAQIVINQWLRQYNHVRPHQALNMRPPVPETLIRNGTEPGGSDSAMIQLTLSDGAFSGVSAEALIDPSAAFGLITGIDALILTLTTHGGSGQVSEPAILALFGFGAAGMVLVNRRMRRRNDKG